LISEYQMSDPPLLPVLKVSQFRPSLSVKHDMEEIAWAEMQILWISIRRWEVFMRCKNILHPSLIHNNFEGIIGSSCSTICNWLQSFVQSLKSTGQVIFEEIKVFTKAILTFFTPIRSSHPDNNAFSFKSFR
jgi:hypothetical protein